MSAPSTEIHVAIADDRVSALQGMFLLRSLVRNGYLPGPWKLVFTTAPASRIGYGAPCFAWQKHANVEFRPVPEESWTRRGWPGVLLQRLLYRYESDVVLYMSLGELVVGGLAALVRRTAAGHAWLSVPVWQPPGDIDLDALLSRLKLPPPNGELRYTGYGLAHLTPGNALPLFTPALAAAPAAMANAVASSLMPDWDAVTAAARTPFSVQLALMVNLLRHQVPLMGLDLRYGLVNAEHYDGPAVQGPEADAAFAAYCEARDDARVLHYCLETDAFQAQRDFNGLGAVRSFLAREDGDAGVQRLRAALRPLDDAPAAA